MHNGLLDFNGVALHRLMTIQNSVLVFGGIDTLTIDLTDRIYQYNALTDKWSQSGIRLPDELVDFGCVSVLNAEFMLIFGGYVKYGNEEYNLDI